MIKENFSEIYQANFDKIYRYLWPRVGRDREVALDLTQETFTRAFKYAGTFEDQGYTYHTYLRRIAHNLLVDHYRRHQSHPKLLEINEAEIVDEKSVNHLDRQWFGETLKQAINHLPPLTRQILALKYESDLPTRAIAEQVGKTENAVKLILSRARKQLAAHPQLKIYRDGDSDGNN